MPEEEKNLRLEHPLEPPDSWIQDGKEWAQSLAPPRPEQVRQTLALLESMQRRPMMHFGNSSPSEVLAQFNMLHHGFYCAGFQTWKPSHFDIARERGWEMRSTGYWDDMGEQGYSHEEMVRETLEIEIEVWWQLLKTAEERER